MPFIIGRKLEMTQQFKEDGTVVPVTLVKAEPNVVTQLRTEDKDGYVAVQLGTDVKRELLKPQAGHLKDLPQAGTLREFRVDPTDLTRGATVDVSVFTPGMHVDVVGTSKGKGFAGVMKRHHFSGGPATHGQKDQMRMPGSLASQRQGPVSKGQRMAGHMGAERVTVKNLEIVSVDAANNVLAIKGAVPGARGGLLLVVSRDAKTVWQK
jgi:large subunit ribosomal protein L3